MVEKLLCAQRGIFLYYSYSRRNLGDTASCQVRSDKKSREKSELLERNKEPKKKKALCTNPTL